MRRDQPSSLAAGTVLSQSPATRQKDGCVVALAVSDGSLVRVPPLQGLPGDQARAATLKLKLRFEAKAVNSEQTPGTVTTQSLPAGREVPPGTVVAVTVAQPNDVTVPDVIGLPADAAAQKLSLFTVARDVVESVRPEGEVTDQDPRAPATRKRGATVRIVVSDGSLVEVPDVTQLALGEARRRLDAVGAGFSVTTTTLEDAAAPDTVVGQSPPAKAVVKRGSGVALQISLGLAVPSVVGLQLPEARSQLAPFEVSSAYVADVAPRDRVLAQDPAPPARLAGRARVALRVSDASLVAVPDVTTMTRAAARSALQAVDLDVQRGEGPDRDSATVVQQTPAPAAIVPRASAVRLDLKDSFPPVWLIAVASVLGALGAGAAAYKFWPKLIKVETRIEFGAAPTQPEGAARAGPDISIEARLEPGASTITPPEGGPP